MTTVNIEDVSAMLADEGYADQNGVKRQDNPRFIFFDDAREMDSDILWGRELALEFEEWVATQNHNEALDSRKESYARHSQGKYVSDDFEAPTPEDVLAYLERQEARGLCNWIIEWHKRRVPTNDHWRKLVMPLVSHLDDPVLGSTAKCVLSTLKGLLPFAPGPVTGTTFINPDGSRFQTAGISPGSAKASFIKRHKLDEEFVSVDRVQYDGERGSRYVVGTRRSSETTPSRYYDPNPAWQDTIRKEGYLPNNAAFLIMLDLSSPVMPSGSHRLTVREFEQALIAGAEIMDDPCERTAHELEEEYLPDARVLMINVGYGNAQYDPMVFSHEEEYLCGILRKFAKDADDSFWKDAIEKLHLRDEDADIMRDHFHEKGGKPTPQLVDLLDYVSWADKTMPSDSGPYLPFVLATLTQYGETEYVSPTAESYSNAVALFDDDEHAWEIPTATGVRLCTFRNWK